MLDGYWNLINTEKPPPQTEPSSYDQLQQAQTYNDVLVRIRGLVSDEKESSIHKQAARIQPRNNQLSFNSTLAQDIDKNHKALKEIIQLIDNRETSRYSKLRTSETQQAQTKGRWVERRSRGSGDPIVVDSDLAEVREELRRVIELIDNKLQKNHNNRHIYKDIETTPNCKSQIDNNIDKRPTFISKLHERGSISSQLDYLRLPKPGTQQIQSKSSFPSKPSAGSGQYLNLKQSFDRLNQTQPHRSLLLQSSIFPPHAESKESPLRNILPQSHITQRREHLSAPKTFHTQSRDPAAKQQIFLGPRVMFIHSGRPVSVLASDNSFGCTPQAWPQVLNPKILRNQPITLSPRTLQYTNSPVQPRYYSPPQHSLPSSHFSNRINIFHPNPFQSLLNPQHQTNQVESLKRWVKGKNKFSFRHHLQQQKASAQRQGKLHAAAADSSLKMKVPIDFPQPLQQEKLIQNPFNSWHDKSEQEAKIQIRSELQKDSLQQIPELPEDISHMSILQQIGEGKKSLQLSMKKSLGQSLSRESLMVRSGEGGLKRRGIGLYQPTYQSQFNSNH